MPKAPRANPMAPTIGKYRPKPPKPMPMGKKPGKGPDYKKEKAANPNKSST